MQRDPPPPDAQHAACDSLDALLGHELLLVTGKGGVGKSTLAAILARAAAGAQKRVLLLEFESVSRVAPLFGGQPVGADARQVAPHIWAQSLTAMDSLRYFATRQLKVPALVHLALRNKAVDGFFKASPAVRPALFLYQLWRTVEEHGPRGDRHWDLIICDLPTSGFVAGMYAIPNMLAGVFRTGPIATYADGMRAMLRDAARTGLTIVTLPEDMPVVEALELRAFLRERHGVEVAAVVLNAVMQRALEPEVLAALDRAADDSAALAGWKRTADRVADRRGKAVAAAARLRSDLPPGALLSLPWRSERELALPAIDALVGRLREGVI